MIPRRSPWIAGLAALFLALIAGPWSARAADPIRVLVISTGAGDPVTAHVLNELVSLGITVEVTPSLEGSLEALTRERGATAALRVAPSRRSLTLWVEPPRSPSEANAQDAQEQTFDEPNGDADDAAASLALRAVELLRARLVKIAPDPSRAASTPDAAPARASPAPSSAPPTTPSSKTSLSKTPSNTAPPAARPADLEGAPTPSPSRSPSPSPSSPAARRSRSIGSFSFHLSPTIVTHPAGGLATSGAALGGVRWMFLPRVGGDLMILAPVIPAIVSSPKGQASIAAGAVGVGAWVDLLGQARSITTGAGLGIAAGFLMFDGEATSSDVRAQDGSIAYALPYARWALSWRALPPVGLRADVLTGVAMPRPLIHVEGRDEYAIFGRPLLAMSLGVEVTLP